MIMTTLDIYAIALAGQERAAAPEGAAVEPARRPWLSRLLSWFIHPRPARKLSELPPNFLRDNHLRRDIGLDPIWPDAWRR
jgi:hypothetical protein